MKIFGNFFLKKCQVFGNFLTVKWQFSGGSKTEIEANRTEHEYISHKSRPVGDLESRSSCVLCTQLEETIFINNKYAKLYTQCFGNWQTTNVVSLLKCTGT